MKLHFRPASGRVAGICLAVGLLACNLGLAQTVEAVTSTLEPQFSVRLAEALDKLPMNPYAPEEQRQVPIRMRMPVWTEELGRVDLDKYTEEELDRMVDNYWTHERMVNAIPVEHLVLDEELDRKNLGKNPLISTPLIPEMLVVEPAFPQSNPNKAKPNGKVFYRNPINGKNYVCSGSAVNGDTKRLVATAAHCVHDGPNGTWYENWRFIPNFTIEADEGTLYAAHPDGKFRGTTAHALPDWKLYGDTPRGFNSDVAFMVTRANEDSVLLVNAVGGHGLKIGGGYYFNSVIFGYPTNFFGGLIMWRCDEAAGIRSWGNYDFMSVNTCDFGGGSSGGPWLNLYSNSSGLGYLKSVTSWGTKRIKWNGLVVNLNLNGPYFSYSTGLIYIDANNDTGWNGE